MARLLCGALPVGGWLALALLFAAPARGEESPWLLHGELGGGLVLSEPQASLFGPGGSVALAGYRVLSPLLSVGLRLRGAAFVDGDSPDVSRFDPQLGGLGALSLAGRLRPLATGDETNRASGPWVELALGAGLTGDLLRPVGEAAIGFHFAAGPVALGPFARYLHLLQTGTGQDGTDAKIILLGAEVVFFGKAPPARLPPMVVTPAPIPALPPPTDSDGDGILDADDRCPIDPEDKDGFEDADGCPDNDNDRDGIADVDDRCPLEAEVVNGIDDQDGCPDQGLIQMIDDRVVLEERVLFDTERSRVTAQGRRVLGAVVNLWKQHPEWVRMEVEGHADYRGPDSFNDELSQRRADRVRDALVDLGFPADKLSTKGFGSRRPRADGTDPDALQTNRRVELVVIRTIEDPAAADGAAEGDSESPAGDAPDLAPPPIEPAGGAGN